MRLTILGCSGPYPAAGGATSGYLLEEQGQAVLMDCGSGIAGRLIQRMDPAQLQAILLTHTHFDHAADLLVLQYYLANTGKTLPLYLPEDDHSPMRGLLNAPVYQLMDYGEGADLGSLHVQAMPTRHPVPCRAVRVTNGQKTLVYTGDAAEGESLVAFCRGADFLLADGAFLEKQWHDKAPHMSAHRAAVLAKEAGVQQLLITHLPPSNVPELLLEEAQRVFPNAQLAVPGKQYEL